MCKAGLGAGPLDEDEGTNINMLDADPVADLGTVSVAGYDSVPASKPDSDGIYPVNRLLHDCQCSIACKCPNCDITTTTKTTVLRFRLIALRSQW